MPVKKEGDFMKKLLCLLLACVCLLGLTSCKQSEEEKYYAYVSASFLDGFGAHNVYPQYVGKGHHLYYQDETASPTAQITVQGENVDLEYEKSENSGFYPIHYYDIDLSHSQNGVRSISAEFRSNGGLERLFVYYEDEMDSQHWVSESQAIEAAKAVLHETANIDVEKECFVSASGLYDQDSESYNICFYKRAESRWIVLERIFVSVRKDGKVTRVLSKGWGMTPDNVDYDFDPELVEKALQERMEIAYQEASELYGEPRFYLPAEVYQPYIELDCDGQPILYLHVRVYFVKDGEIVTVKGWPVETMLEYVVLKEPAKDEYLELAPGS